MDRLAFSASITLTLALPLCGRAAGDILVLESGGQLRGEIVETGDPARPAYVVVTREGGRVTVARSLVEQLVTENRADEEYLQRAHRAPDTVESHWKLAEWCRARDLVDRAEQHLERILELDPHHEEARTRLGYRPVEGEWMTRADLMEDRGMVLYRGKYRSVQEIALWEQAEKREESEGEWRVRLRMLFRRLESRDPERVLEARRELEAIRDPLAAEELVELLEDERRPEVGLMLLKVLAGIDHHVALNAVVSHALQDPAEEIRAQSLDYLLDSGRPNIAAPFIRGLKHPDNVVVNRAATVLEEIGNPAAIGPLIDALVTQHRAVIGGSSSGGDTYAVSPTSGSFSFGSNKPRVVQGRQRNPRVLSALVALSGGQSFDYDQRRWHAWLAAQSRVNQIDMRRDR